MSTHAKGPPTHTKACSPCQSLVDYGNTQVTQYAFRVSESSKHKTWELYRKREQQPQSNLLYYMPDLYCPGTEHLMQSFK